MTCWTYLLFEVFSFIFGLSEIKSEIRQIIKLESQINLKQEETFLNLGNKCFVQVIYGALILVFCKVKCIENSIPWEHSKNKKTLVILVHLTQREWWCANRKNWNSFGKHEIWKTWWSWKKAVFGLLICVLVFSPPFCQSLSVYLP